ncbi:CAP domain-containing protein [Paenibacillus sp. CMAA1364]
MAKMIVLALILLVTGCSADNNMTQKQVTPKQTQISTYDHTTSQKVPLTQASSIATRGKASPSITAKGMPNEMISKWFNLIQTPTRNPEKTEPTGSTGQVQEGAKDTNKGTTPFGQQVLDLVNQERSKAGLSALSMNDQLANMALVKAQDMYDNNYFDHNSPTHGSPFDMMKEFGITYSYAGENIAKGQTTPAQVMKDWMNSTGHKANILSNNFTQIGVGYYNNAWVQEFKG